MNKITDMYSTVYDSAISYANYIQEHRSNVRLAFEQVEDALSSIVSTEDIRAADLSIRSHDQSKMSPEEFSPYRKKYYPCIQDVADESEYDFAWIHHVQHNDHHPEHWCVSDDKRGVIKGNMPIHCIIEMLCDWHSFSFQNPSSTALSYFKNVKREYLEKILSPESLDKVETLAVLFSSPLRNE